MNARHKALVASTVIRSKLLGIGLDEAIAATLEKTCTKASEAERKRLLRDAVELLKRLHKQDKPTRKDLTA